MLYKPTLVGLKKGQEFLAESGFSLPVFEMDICHGCGEDGVLKPGAAKIIAIEEAIAELGADSRVVDVRLTDAHGKRLIQFVDPIHTGAYTSRDARKQRNEVIVYYYEGNPPDEHFRFFFSSRGGKQFLKLAQCEETKTMWPAWLAHVFRKRIHTPATICMKEKSYG